jgi:hypothetical protein
VEEGGACKQYARAVRGRASPAQIIAGLHVPETNGVEFDVVDDHSGPLVLLVELHEVGDIIREGAGD